MTMFALYCGRHYHIDEFVGQEVVGYRYGQAPKNGRSYNQMDACFEPGVSMAQIGYLPEYWSLTTLNYRENKMKRYYYKGKIVGVGGDGEACLEEVKQISYNEYRTLRAQNKALYAEMAKIYIDDYIGADKYGLRITDDAEAYENYVRNKYVDRSLPLGFVKGSCPDWWKKDRPLYIAKVKDNIKKIKKRCLLK